MIFHIPFMREYVRAEFNQANLSGFVSENDIDKWLNEAYLKYVGVLLKTDEGYFEETFDLDITGDDEEVLLPNLFDNTTHRKITTRVSLLERKLSTVNVPLTYRRRLSQPNATQAAVSGSTYVPTYKFRDGKVILEPTPGDSETGGLFLTAQVMPPRLISGNPQAAGASTITLQTEADPRDDYYNDARLIITDGTGVDQIRKITNYVGSTRVATLDSAWSTVPNATSTYSLLIHEDFPESYHELLPLYAAKKAFMKERAKGTVLTYDSSVLKEMEREFKTLFENRSTARKFAQPWNLELDWF